MKQFAKRFLAIAMVLFILVTAVPIQRVRAESNSDMSETSENTYLLNYVVVDKPFVETPDTQNVVLSIGDETTQVEQATLTYQNISTQQEYQVEATNIVNNVMLFSMEYLDETWKGIYELVNVSFVVSGETYVIVMQETGANPKFGINEEFSSDADAIIVEDGSKDEVEIARLDENGNSLPQESISDAIESAINEAANEGYPTSQKRMGNVVVVLDPGHGGSDPGTCNGGLCERDINLKIAEYCKAELEQYNGVTVYMTRTDNSSACMDREQRAAFARDRGANVLVSIHINAGGGTGSEVWYPNSNYNANVSTAGQALGNSILAQLANLGLTNRGTKIRNANEDKYPDGSASDYYGINSWCKRYGFPGIIVEHAFIDNANDQAYLSNEEWLRRMGIADATGIANYFGLSKGVSIWGEKFNNSTVAVGSIVTLGYETTKAGTINVDIYDGNDVYFMPLYQNISAGEGHQTLSWDLKTPSGKYVNSGKYRFTIQVTDAQGNTAVSHQYFTVTGNDAFAYKWTKLSSDQYQYGQNAELYYAVSKSAVVNIDIYDQNDSYLRSLVQNKSVATNDQVAVWDYTNAQGELVQNGKYRFTITATSASGEKIVEHKYFSVTGIANFQYKWCLVGNQSVNIGNNQVLYYATSKKAKVTVELYNEKNEYIKTLFSNQSVGANDQAAVWDLTDGKGDYVSSGTYRFTIKATDSSGNTVVSHQYFKVTGNDPVSYKWCLFGNESVKVGNKQNLYYAVTKNATVTVEVYDGKNEYIKTLDKNKAVGTNDQVAVWDLTDGKGDYVSSGTYRFTIKATDSSGNTVVSHQYFKVTGNDPVSYKWTTLDNSTYSIGNKVSLYYAVTRNAKVTAEVYDGKDNYMLTLFKDKSVGTNDQVLQWDMKATNGIFVSSGTYRITLKSVDTVGNVCYAHKYFYVDGGYTIMGTPSTSVQQMVAYYKANQLYPSYYASVGSDAPTIEAFCQIYMEECLAEGVKTEVAFCQAMKETGFLRYGGDVNISQYNFAGLGATGGGNPGNTFSSVREGVRAQIQHLKAYASTEPLKNPCVDNRFSYVTRGTAPCVEWLGIQENPYGKGWATAKNYGYSIRDDYIAKLVTY